MSTVAEPKRTIQTLPSGAVVQLRSDVVVATRSSTEPHSDTRMMSFEARLAIQYEDCANAGAVSRENARRVSFFMVAESEWVVGETRKVEGAGGHDKPTRRGRDRFRGVSPGEVAAVRRSATITTSRRAALTSGPERWSLARFSAAWAAARRAVRVRQSP